MAQIRGMVLAIVVIAASACAAPPARAMFPGANGKIVVSAKQYDNLGDVVSRAAWMVTLDGRAVRLRGVDQATFSPYGKRLAYHSILGSDGIVVSRADRSRRRHVTRGEDYIPVWSPDGKMLAFVRDGYPRTSNGLNVVGSTDGRRRRLYAGRVSEIAWSPSGKKLAIATDPNDVFAIPRIRVVDLDGRVTDVGQGRHISWTRAGLAYRRDDALYVTRSDARNERLVANGFSRVQNSEYDGCPAEYAWSPDGTQIAFDRDGEIYVASATGEAPRAIARSGGEAGGHCGGHALSFSPDGRLVAFSSGWDGLSIVSADGGRKRLVTRVPRDGPWAASIDWQARPRSR